MLHTFYWQLALRMEALRSSPEETKAATADSLTLWGEKQAT